MEDINLHFTGDIHAVAAANNLLAAMLVTSILHRDAHRIDLGGRANGYRRESGFDITAASEVMAILAVARDLQDLRGSLGAITVAYSDGDSTPITAEDLQAAGAVTVLLKDAIKPNLIQTLEGQPCLMHAGPFANIAPMATTRSSPTSSPRSSATTWSSNPASAPTWGWRSSWTSCAAWVASS